MNRLIHLKKPKLIAPILVIAVLLLGTGFYHKAAAATGQIFIEPVSPASGSVQVGSDITMEIAINPPSKVDTVQYTLQFDSSRLQFVSRDSSASNFDTAFKPGTTSNTVYGAVLSTAQNDPGVTADNSLVTYITFKALSTTGAAQFSFLTTGTYPTVAEYNGNNVPVSLGTDSINVTAATTSVNPPTTKSTAPKSNPSPTKSTSTATKTTAPNTSTETSNPVAASSVAPQLSTLTAPQTQFTQASINLTTNVPTQAYIKYGTDKSLSNATTADAFATSHELSLNGQALTPGTVYYYEVVVVGQNGQITTSGIKSFQTKGFTIKVAVLDKHDKPLKNTVVTLHSTPTTAKTNSQGIATFTNVAPGLHHVIYSNDSEAVTVDDTIQNTGTTQSAAIQNLAVVLTNVNTKSSALPVILVVLVLAVAAAIVVWRSRHPYFKPATVPGVIDDPDKLVTVSPSTTNVNPSDQPAAAPAPSPMNTTEQLQTLKTPETPLPGTTVAPAPPSNDKDDSTA